MIFQFQMKYFRYQQALKTQCKTYNWTSYVVNQSAHMSLWRRCVVSKSISQTKWPYTIRHEGVNLFTAEYILLAVMATSLVRFIIMIFFMASSPECWFYPAAMLGAYLIVLNFPKPLLASSPATVIQSTARPCIRSTPTTWFVFVVFMFVHTSRPVSMGIQSSNMSTKSEKRHGSWGFISLV